MGFFKMRCGKRGVVSLFVRSAALYCATCRGAAAQRKSPQAFSTVGFLAAIPKSTVVEMKSGEKTGRR